MLPYCVEVYATIIVSYTILERRYVTGPSVSFLEYQTFLFETQIYIYNMYSYVN